MIEIKGILGKYKIVKKLGSGGFGTVYLAEDTILKTSRALKIPHRMKNDREKIFKESIVQTRLLDHPNIVKLLTVDIIEGNLIMVMEYIDGTDLEKIIDSKAKLTISKALFYFSQILSALEYAHKKKILHRDIRPSNILVNKSDQIKITDFGTSTLLDEKAYATTKIGSPPYMAPEQFEGKAVFASDIYSAGCLFYEMITGFPPVVSANPVEIYKIAKAGNFPPLIKKKPEIRRELNSVIMKTLSPAISERYSSVTSLLRDLNTLENKKNERSSNIDDIKTRIEARNARTDYKCWNCKKTMPRRIKKCIYCGAVQ